MRKTLAMAALVALLGLIADVSEPAAQFFQGDQRVMPGVFAPDWREQPEKPRKPKVTARHHVKAHKHRVVRAPPNQRKVAERNGYKRLSELVSFPAFFPGLGILFVKPDTLPLGPYLCFDRSDHLVATVYMIPIKEVDDHTPLEAAGFSGGAVDHVSLYFNAGHPGADMPHYHVVLWHVSKKDEARVAK